MHKAVKHFGEERIFAAVYEIVNTITAGGVRGPISADASYQHERFGAVRAKVVFDRHVNRYLAGERYAFWLVLEFEKSQSKMILASGDEASVLDKIAAVVSETKRTELLALLKNLYRGALDP